MAFPQPISVTESVHDTAVTNHVVALPTLLAGELAIVLFSNSGGTDSGTFPAGWTKAAGSGAGAFNIAGCWAWRVCNGTEGASITVTTGSAFRSAHQVYRIQGHDSSTVIPVGPSGLSGSDASAELAGIDPTGTKDFLFIPFVVTDSGVLATAAPTNYTNLNTLQSGTQANLSAGLSSCYRQLNADTEDPDQFTLASAEGWITWIIAVHPGTEGNPAPSVLPWEMGFVTA